MRIKLSILCLTLLPLSTFAQSKVVKVLASKTRFTIQKVDGINVGKKIVVSDIEHIYKTLEAGVLDCKKKTCLAEMISNPQRIQIAPGSLVDFKNTGTWSAEFVITNTIGLTPSVGLNYDFPSSPWSAGVKYKKISTTIGMIKVAGHLISAEAQRNIWYKSRFKIWAIAEIGIAKVEVDLSSLSNTEPKKDKLVNFINVGFDGRYKLTTRLQAVGGVGIIRDNLSQDFTGDFGVYKLEAQALNFTHRIGLIYSF